MRKSTIIKKDIKKLPKPTQKESAKKIVQRLKDKKNGNIRSFLKVTNKPSNQTKKPAKEKPKAPTLLRDPDSYKKFLELPVYEPTNEEFKQPLLLMKKLYDIGYSKFGCVKLRTPKNWNPEFSFLNGDKKITTRKQNLRDLVKGKNFDQNINGYTVDEFKDQAEEFQEEYKRKAPFDFDDIKRANEYEFWALIEDPQLGRNKIEVQYAADLPTRRYGSAFPTIYKGKFTDPLNAANEKTHPFNLNNINRAKDSLFQFMTTKSESISGITSPWIYFGMLFASFCWHVEDLYMYSVNYMHKGAPKTWYCIPPDYKATFDHIIKEKHADLFSKQPGLLHNIVLTMNPIELMERDIPVYRTEQNPREFIVTFPKSYHAGFSHGFNISEAVNIATIDWIPYARNAVEDYAKEGFHKKGSFPYEWLVIANIQNLEDLDISKPSKEQEKLAREYEIVKMKEYSDRNLVKQCYGRVVTRQFEDNLTKYDSQMCVACKNYIYLSSIECMTCKKKVCTNHVTICNCVGATVILNIRFTDEELDEFSQKMKPATPRKRTR